MKFASFDFFIFFITTNNKIKKTKNINNTNVQNEGFFINIIQLVERNPISHPNIKMKWLGCRRADMVEGLTKLTVL